MKNSILIWIIKLIAVVILLQTLYFKFSAADESVYIFSTLGVEPYGRIGSGVIELIASILILIPRTTLFGALLGFFTMLGVIFSHLFILGIVVQKDGGTLFALALITFFCCIFLMYKNRHTFSRLLSYKI